MLRSEVLTFMLTTYFFPGGQKSSSVLALAVWYTMALIIHNPLPEALFIYMNVNTVMRIKGERSNRPGADPGVGKGRGTNRLSVVRWLEKIELAK